MTAFKKLNRKDSYTSVYISKKNWTVSESDFNSLGIKLYKSGNKPQYLNQSINHLYYTNENQDRINPQFFENFFQSSFDTKATRSGGENFNGAVLSISSKIFGTSIEPKTFSLELNPLGIVERYVVEGYVDQNTLSESSSDKYITPTDELSNSTESSGVTDESSDIYSGEVTVLPPLSISLISKLVDDGEGNILMDGDLENTIVGNIIYTHGIVTFFDPRVISLIDKEKYYRLGFKSNLPIYTKNFHCNVKSDELNFTLNKSSYNSTTGEINNNISKDAFTPYITSIGLYNDSNELIAVAKTSQPIPKSKFNNTTFNIRLDSTFGIQRSLLTRGIRTNILYFTFANILYRNGRDQGRTTRDEGGYILYQKESSDERLTKNQTKGIVKSNIKGNRFYCYTDVVAIGNVETGYSYRVLFNDTTNISNVRPISFFTNILDEHLLS